MFFLFHKTTRPTGRLLAKALGILNFGSTVKPKHGRPDFVIRWGNAQAVTLAHGAQELNKASAILAASNKLRAFQLMKEADVQTPDFTDNRYTALAWNNATVFGRTRSGTKGRGITIYPRGAQLGEHELYTKYIPNSREYRLHVVGDSVIRTQRKYAERNGAAADAPIKNVANGFVFKAPQKKLNRDREQLAINAVKAVGLDFGAVDMVIDDQGVAYVLEINTAPACSPMTGSAYVTAFAALVRERSNGAYDLPTNYGELNAARATGEVDPHRNVLEAMYGR